MGSCRKKNKHELVAISGASLWHQPAIILLDDDNQTNNNNLNRIVTMYVCLSIYIIYKKVCTGPGPYFHSTIFQGFSNIIYFITQKLLIALESYYSRLRKGPILGSVLFKKHDLDVVDCVLILNKKFDSIRHDINDKIHDFHDIFSFFKDLIGIKQCGT